jgi:hypothetical protein
MKIQKINGIDSFLVESPRWLLSKGFNNRAYKMVFGNKVPSHQKEVTIKEEKVKCAEKLPFSVRMKQSFSILTALYGQRELRKRALICHYTWMVTSLCYYVTGETTLGLKYKY